MFSKKCINCHYFIKQCRNDDGSEMKLEIKHADRSKIKENDFSCIADYFALACYRGVWDEGHNFDKSERHNLICKTNRANRCYFWKYMPGTFLPAAAELQEKHESRKGAGRSYRLTKYSLLVAIVGLLYKVFSG